MKMGTKSLLFGVHQFLWHPLTVARAWRHLYGKWPRWREWVCIIVHDIGYWGAPNMDGDEGTQHPLRGAHLVGRLFGADCERLVLLHSRTLSRKFGLEPSKLCWPDKASIAFDPAWFYLARARLSGEILEYHRNAIRCGFVGPGSTQREWLLKLQDVAYADAKREAEAHL